MAQYPIEPDKLLVAASLLVPARPGRGRPSYTAHRRGVSTAYYAVFHAIGGRVVRQVFPTADAIFRDGVRRWSPIRTSRRSPHGLARSRARCPAGHRLIFAALLAPTGVPTFDADTVSIADGFLELHEKRKQADYDHQAVFTRAETLGLLELARQIVATVEAIESNGPGAVVRADRHAG